MNASRPVLRRCVACRQLLDRSMLLRVIRDHQEGVLFDQGMGRSAYLCPTEACFEEARRRKRLQKSLRCQVSDDLMTALQERLTETRVAAAEAR